MSEVTAVPLRPIAKGSLVKLWVGIAVVLAIAIAGAYYGTNRQVGTSTNSGIRYQVIDAGSGPLITADDVVAVKYEAKRADGEVVDTTAVDNQPRVFPVTGVIPGLSEGLQLMHKGSRYRFWIPAALAYGARGTPDGKIPPNTDMVFDVTVVEAIPAAQLRGMMPPGGAGGHGGM